LQDIDLKVSHSKPDRHIHLTFFYFSFKSLSALSYKFLKENTIFGIQVKVIINSNIFLNTIRYGSFVFYILKIFRIYIKVIKNMLAIYNSMNQLYLEENVLIKPDQLLEQVYIALDGFWNFSSGNFVLSIFLTF